MLYEDQMPAGPADSGKGVGLLISGRCFSVLFPGDVLAEPRQNVRLIWNSGGPGNIGS